MSNDDLHDIVQIVTPVADIMKKSYIKLLQKKLYLLRKQQVTADNIETINEEIDLAEKTWRIRYNQTFQAYFVHHELIQEIFAAIDEWESDPNTDRLYEYGNLLVDITNDL